MTSPHRYGPHRPEDAPNAVTVLTPSPRHGGSAAPLEVVRALPAELVAQRAQLNELARARGAGEGTAHHCQAKDREVWLPGSWCPFCRATVVTS